MAEEGLSKSQRNYGKGRADAGGAATTTSSSKPAADSRLIFALMLWAGGFAFVGNEITRNANGQSVSPTKPDPGMKIIIGTFAATAVLSLVSKAGDPGRQFAVGLATVAVVTSTLVYGAPVWKLLNAVVGGTTGTGPGQTPTKASTPTGSASVTRGVSATIQTVA